MKFIVLIALVAVVSFAILFLSNPLNHVVLFNAEGSLDEKKFLDVEQGDSISDVRRLLVQRGLSEQDFVALEIERCANRQVPDADYVYLFRDRSWRRGVVCVFTLDNEVINIAWSFNPLAP